MADVLHRFIRTIEEGVTTVSVALRCPNCQRITWAFEHMDWTSCHACGLRFYNRAGKWWDGTPPPAETQTVNPKG